MRFGVSVEYPTVKMILELSLQITRFSEQHIFLYLQSCGVDNSGYPLAVRLPTAKSYKVWSQYIVNVWPLAYAYPAKGTEYLVHMLLLKDML